MMDILEMILEENHQMPSQLELFLIKGEKTWNENKLERRELSGRTEWKV